MRVEEAGEEGEGDRDREGERRKEREGEWRRKRAKTKTRRTRRSDFEREGGHEILYESIDITRTRSAPRFVLSKRKEKTYGESKER